MKKAPIILVIVSFLLISCSTVMKITYLRPSEVDMSNYRNLAIASAKVSGSNITPGGYIDYSGPDLFDSPMHTYSSSIEQDIASFATDELYMTLSNPPYFNLLDPDTTDSIIRKEGSAKKALKSLKDLGYDALMIPTITLRVDESAYYVPKTENVYDQQTKQTYHRTYIEHYLRQEAKISYKLEVLDTSTGATVAVKTFVDSRVSTSSIDNSFYTQYDRMENYFKTMLRSFDDGIREIFLVTTAVYKVSPMPNSPKNKDAEEAYYALKKGYMATAFDVFLSVWESDAHVPSGYNAALILADYGDFAGAYALLEEVYARDSSEKIEKLIDALGIMNNLTSQAGKQLGVGNVTVSDEGIK